MELAPLDLIVFGTYFVVLCGIGFWVGRGKKQSSDEYFLAGRNLPWYVVGGSFIASNISAEHFIGMVGAAYVYGIVVSLSEWRNLWTFSLLIWFFIPFLLATRVFTIPEFLEKRFNLVLRQFFALVTIICNITAFLAAVLYGGGLALEGLFGWNLDVSIVALAVVAGSWAIYGGLRSVVWTDFFTVIVMLVGGITVTILGLTMLGGSVAEGFDVLWERNQAQAGPWKAAVDQTKGNILPGAEEYDRLSVIQPITHPTHPWPFMVIGFLSVSLWYNILNQFMIQRVLAAKDIYHARMGIVLAGYLKILLPFLVVIPGLILFAKYPDVLMLPWDEVRPQADKGYVRLVQELVPIGLRGLILAALFGAIQSTVNSVLNSTSTIFTLDIYKRVLRPNSSEPHLVRVGVISSVVLLVVSILLARYIGTLKGSLFVYIQSMYAFFAPPFAAVFLLGILWRRINAVGAMVAVFAGFALGIAMKLYVSEATDPVAWIKSYEMQAITNWMVCMVICIVASLLSAPPAPEKVTDQITFNWKQLNLREGLGDRWYQHVGLWWGIFVVILLSLLGSLSGTYL